MHVLTPFSQQGMLELASPLSKMLPDLSAAGVVVQEAGGGAVPGTPPPRSPPRSNGHRRVSTGKEEGERVDIKGMNISALVIFAVPTLNV